METQDLLLRDVKTGKLSIDELCILRDVAVYAHEQPLRDSDAIALLQALWKLLTDKKLSDEEASDRFSQITTYSVRCRRRAPCQQAMQAILNCSCTAMPVISNCLKCKSHLHSSDVDYEHRPTMLYSFGQLGRRCRLYVKRCKKCRIVYQLDGYQTEADYKAGGGEKLSYSPQHTHPDYFRYVALTWSILSLAC